MTADAIDLIECSCLLPGEGEAIRIFDEEFNLKITGDDTAGAYAILSGTVAPGGGPPLHAHPGNETFYVLSGEMMFTQRTAEGVSVFRGGPGAIVHAPAHVPHRFENVSPARSAMLMVVSPEAVDFLRDLSAAFPPGSEPDMEKMLTIHARYQVETFHGEDGSRSEPSKDGAASTRARALAWEFEHANDGLIETLERCSEEQWRAVCPDTGWTVGVQAHHVAANYPIIAGVIRDIAEGHPHPPMPPEKLDSINAQHAQEFAGTTKAQVLALLKANGPTTAQVYRLLSDEQLARSAVVTSGAREQTVERLLQDLAIGEITRHGAAIRQALAN